MDSSENATGRQSRWKFWSLLAIVGLLGGVIGGLVVATTRTTPETPVTCSARTVADKVLPSVVTISVQGAKANGTGSGNIIRDDGYILTNNHVIAAAASGGKIEVGFSDGTTAPATITGRDPLADLAVIKVTQPEKLPVIEIGKMDRLQVGQQVIALGAPLGLSSTVTAGIVSALGRTIAVPGEDDRNALIVAAIQTDAAINPGNSGGALTDCDGKLVGVPTAGATVPSVNGNQSAGSVGLGFAIPIGFAMQVADEIISTGKVAHSFLGVQVAPIPENAAQLAGTEQGLFILGVVAGSPAAQAGLRPNDIITKIDGQVVSSTDQLLALSLSRRPGTQVKITYLRDGKSNTLPVTLAARTGS